MRLSAEQKAKLQALEGKVRRGQQAFLAMCGALREIEEQELYRATHDSMAQYCAERWDMSPSETTRYRNAGQVLHNLDGFEQVPEKESQARELARVKDPEEQRAIWQSVLASEKPVTAGLIGKVIAGQETLEAPENDESSTPTAVCEPIDTCADDEVPIDYRGDPAKATAGGPADARDEEWIDGGYDVAIDKICCAHRLLVEALDVVRQHDAAEEGADRLLHEVGEIIKRVEEIEEHLVDRGKETGNSSASFAVEELQR